MAEYTKVFNNPYPNGWEDLPSENTPITAHALQEHTDAIESLEQYLEDNPITDSTDVQWNQIRTSGTKIAEITIGGETTEVLAPNGGGSASIEYGNESAYNEWLKTAQDGEIFVRTDDNEGGSGGSGEIYDDTERVIGTWFDKTLYKKTFLISNVVNGITTVSQEKLNIKFMQGRFVYKANGNTSTFFNINASNDYVVCLQSSGYSDAYKTYIDIRLGAQRVGAYSLELTLEYTKDGD